MALKTITPSNYAAQLEASQLTSGFLLRSKSKISFVMIVLWTVILLLLYTLTLPSFITGLSKGLGEHLFPNVIWLLVSVLPLGLLFSALKNWNSQMNLEPAELLLNLYPIRRGQQLELRFLRRLKSGQTLPNSGLLEWVLSCAEVTKTKDGSSVTYSQEVLWSADFSAVRVAAGAASLEARATVDIPQHLPPSYTGAPPRLSGWSNQSSNSWIEWKLRAALSIKGLDGEAEFVLLVK